MCKWQSNLGWWWSLPPSHYQRNWNPRLPCHLTDFSSDTHSGHGKLTWTDSFFFKPGLNIGSFISPSTSTPASLATLTRKLLYTTSSALSMLSSQLDSFLVASAWISLKEEDSIHSLRPLAMESCCLHLANLRLASTSHFEQLPLALFLFVLFDMDSVMCHACKRLRNDLNQWLKKVNSTNLQQGQPSSHFRIYHQKA